MEKIDRRMLLGAAGIAGIAAVSRLASGGPAPRASGPSGTEGMGPGEVHRRTPSPEARIAVQSLPGGATALHVISEPGSYCLTANIHGAAGKNGIEIRADHVTLDLCGFELVGAAGSGVGILAEEADGVAALNGVVSRWGSHGVQFSGSACSVRDVRALGNEGVGIHVAKGGLVEACIADGNLHYGVEVLEACSVLGCVARNTRKTGGIIAFHRCRVHGCVSERNALEGIRSDCENLVEANLCADNGGPNIVVGPGTRCVENRCGGGAVGIHAVSNATLLRNTCETQAVGISVYGGRCFIAQNTVIGAAKPYTIPLGNSHGPIVDVAGVGDIAAVWNANHPWANFIY